jgi:peptide-methionine (S)-S-oxide reductase
VAAVIRTRVGYAGGTTTGPSYHDIGDHAETIQIDFDPTRTSYSEMLDIFWKHHDPTSKPWRRQYMSAIFYHNEEQKRLAVESKARAEVRYKHPVYTEILPAVAFYTAEDYHQKYYLRQHRVLLDEFKAYFPNAGDFIDSTAVARVNGYLGGNGNLDELKTEIDGLGLSGRGREALLEIVHRQTP